MMAWRRNWSSSNSVSPSFGNPYNNSTYALLLILNAVLNKLHSIDIYSLSSSKNIYLDLGKSDNRTTPVFYVLETIFFI